MSRTYRPPCSDAAYFGTRAAKQKQAAEQRRDARRLNNELRKKRPQEL